MTTVEEITQKLDIVETMLEAELSQRGDSDEIYEVEHQASTALKALQEAQLLLKSETQESKMTERHLNVSYVDIADAVQDYFDRITNELSNISGLSAIDLLNKQIEKWEHYRYLMLQWAAYDCKGPNPLGKGATIWDVDTTLTWLFQQQRNLIREVYADA